VSSGDLQPASRDNAAIVSTLAMAVGRILFLAGNRDLTAVRRGG
jgi:hypothetical protein